MIKHSKHIALLLLTTAMVSSCGGGSDGDNSGGISINGKVEFPSSSLNDTDTNDDNAPSTDNGSFDSAQIIYNPVSIGGHVNQPGSGSASGSSSADGDISDIYKVSLLEGQTISLSIADGLNNNDLDLYAYPASCTDATCGSQACRPTQTNPIQGQIAGSNQVGTDSELITVGSDIDVFIEVCAYEGSSNYALTIGSGNNGLASAQQDFIPYDAIVKFKQKASSSDLGQSMQALSSSTIRPDQTRSQLIQLNPSQANTYSAASTSSVTSEEHPKRGYVATLGEEYLQKWDTINQLAKVKQRDDVEYAELNYIVEAMAIPNDPAYASQWHYPLINLPETWDVTTGSADVIVAVVDSGVFLNQEDLAGQLISGYDFISINSLSGDGDGIDNNPNDSGNNPGGRHSYHGTHVAGTIGANTDNSTGVAGVSWKSKIMPVRVLGVGGQGSSYDIEQGIRYAAGLSNDSNTRPTQRADVINLSLGGPGSSLQSTQDTINEARQAGTIIVAAAGNSGKREDFYPASYDGVISVGAVDINKSKASYSTFSANVDIAAPGGDNGADVNGDGYVDMILSTSHNNVTGQDDYQFQDGTSMASPHVAGVIALMKAVDPTLTPERVDTLLASGELTDDLGTSGRDDLYGHGLINAYKATNAVSNSPTVLVPGISVTPTSMNFGASTTSLTLFVSSTTGKDAVVQNITSQDSLVSINSSSVDADGFGQYTLTIDRNGRAPGQYADTVIVTSDVSTVEVPIIFQVLDVNTSLEASLGYISAFLADPETLELSYKVEATRNGGAYNYDLRNVQPGEYILGVSSDYDGDNFVCDSGEVCNLYGLDASSIEYIEVTNGNINDINFTITPDVSLSTSQSNGSGFAEQGPTLSLKP